MKYRAYNVIFFAYSTRTDAQMVELIRLFRGHVDVGNVVAYRPNSIDILTELFWSSMDKAERTEVVRIAPESWIIAHADSLTSELNLIESFAIRENPELLQRFDSLIDWHGCSIRSLIRTDHTYIRSIHERFDWRDLANKIAQAVASHTSRDIKPFIREFREFLTDEEFARVDSEITLMSFNALFV